MEKTSREYCKGCIYSIRDGNNTDMMCNYFIMTGQRRNCPVGYCDKKEAKNDNRGKERVFN